MSAAPVLAYVRASHSRSSRRDSRPAAAWEHRQPISGVAFYRKRTEELMQRYLRISMDMGRLPSMLSRTVHRGRATCTRIRNFEDAVVFVIDVERCLKRLDARSLELVARITLQEYTYAEAAELTGRSVRSIARHYGEAVDKLSAVLLEAELMRVDPWERG